jgi:hypothetical protein
MLEFEGFVEGTVDEADDGTNGVDDGGIVEEIDSLARDP